MRNVIRSLCILLALSPTLISAQQYPTVPDHTVIGRVGSGSGSGPSQAIPWATLFSGLIQPCSSSASGSVPATGGGTTKFLRSDCTFAVPPGPSISNNQILANVSGSTASASGTNPATLWDDFCSSSVGQFWVRLSSAWGCTALGYANPVWWGADPIGSSDSASAFNSAVATGLPIQWPIGRFKINSAITKTLPSAQASFVMRGSGSNATTLYWPNASGGITVTAQHDRNTFHISDLTLTTSQVNSGTALHMIGYGGATPNAGRFFQSDIHNVQIMGDDLSTTPASTQYWANAIVLHNWGAIDISNTNTFGFHSVPGPTGGGNGLTFEGDTPTASYATLLNVTRSSFNYHQNGVILGDYWQGITFDQCNWNGEQGGSGIIVSGSSGSQVLLTVTNSQFDSGGSDVIITNGGMLNATFMGNTFTVSANNTVAINSNVTASDGLVVIGNVFNVNGAPCGGTCTGTVGVHQAAGHSIIQGNYFTKYVTAISLDASSSAATVAMNTYNSVTTKIANSSSSNSVGTAAAGNMTGVVP